MLRLIQVCDSPKAFSHDRQNKNSYYLKEIFINENHIVNISADLTMGEKLSRGLLPEDLDKRTNFSKIIMQIGGGCRRSQDSCISVVGNPIEIASKAMDTKKELLKG
jgi:hypothetical protein